MTGLLPCLFDSRVMMFNLCKKKSPKSDMGGRGRGRRVGMLRNAMGSVAQYRAYCCAKTRMPVRNIFLLFEDVLCR